MVDNFLIICKAFSYNILNTLFVFLYLQYLYLVVTSLADKFSILDSLRNNVNTLQYINC